MLVPIANADEVGLRRAITDTDVDRLFGRLCDGQIDDHQNWKGRFKDNSDKMRSGSIFDMADVLKSLAFLARSKSLSFREKRMLDRARATDHHGSLRRHPREVAGRRRPRGSGARTVLHREGARARRGPHRAPEAEDGRRAAGRAGQRLDAAPRV